MKWAMLRRSGVAVIAVVLFSVNGGIPAFAGMTEKKAGMREEKAGMTAKNAEMKTESTTSATEAEADGLFQNDLRLRSKGYEVLALQALLSRFPEITRKPLASGFFNTRTKAAVKRFQKFYGQRATGVVDSKTRDLLNEMARRVALAQKYDQSATSLQALNQKSGDSATSLQSLTERAPGAPPPPEALSTIPTQAAGPEKPKQKPNFEYHWKASNTLTGEITLPKPAPAPVIVLDGTPVKTIASGAAVRLSNFYKINLLDTQEPWDDDSASMLLDTLQRLHTAPFDAWGRNDKKVPEWKLLLTNEKLINDFELYPNNTVRISADAFVRANPLLQPQTANTAPRVFYSNRLYQAVLKIFYADRNHLAQLMRQRFGVALGFGEPKEDFQEFKVDELIFIASVLEDLPSGFHSMPGLNKLVRRRNGMANPFYPEAAALAWVDLGYMEFMDKAFESQGVRYIQQLVAHEFTHFLWHKVLTKETRAQFTALSGWSQKPGPNSELATLTAAPDHPKSSFTSKVIDPWYHDTTTNFVSAYAAAHNPDEDFGETVAYYVYSPDRVRTIAPTKYEFVKKVLKGYEYVILVDKQFTFEVFNLEPDLTFPGKIVAIDTEMYKLENGDNRVIATLHLSKKFGDGAERAYMRLVSRQSTYLDQYFYPVDGNQFLLRADFIINKFAASGYWIPEQITVSDQVDNRRYEPQTQFGWMLNINNPDEDLEPPVPQLGDIRYRVVWGLDDDDKTRVQWVEVTVPVNDKNRVGMGVCGTLAHEETGQTEGRCVTNDTDPDAKGIVLRFPIRAYRASGAWGLRQITAHDIAENKKVYDINQGVVRVIIDTDRPDYIKPTLDISSIRIQATPKYPDAPNGETDVSIWYKANDDNSGLGVVSYALLKPNGDAQYDYNYHENFYTPYFKGDPQESKEYKIELRLPPGSIPGTWILREMTLQDKAGNELRANFVEIGISRPFKVF